MCKCFRLLIEVAKFFGKITKFLSLLYNPGQITYAGYTFIKPVTLAHNFMPHNCKTRNFWAVDLWQNLASVDLLRSLIGLDRNRFWRPLFGNKAANWDTFLNPRSSKISHDQVWNDRWKFNSRKRKWCKSWFELTISRFMITMTIGWKQLLDMISRKLRPQISCGSPADQFCGLARSHHFLICGAVKAYYVYLLQQISIVSPGIRPEF